MIDALIGLDSLADSVDEIVLFEHGHEPHDGRNHWQIVSSEERLVVEHGFATFPSMETAAFPAEVLDIPHGEHLELQKPHPNGFHDRPDFKLSDIGHAPMALWDVPDDLRLAFPDITRPNFQPSTLPTIVLEEEEDFEMRPIAPESGTSAPIEPQPPCSETDQLLDTIVVFVDPAL